VRVYFDTNVLVAALQPDHVHHLPSFAALRRVQKHELDGYLAAHGLIELYSVLTRAPFANRPSPDEVQSLIKETITPDLQIIEVTTQTHLAAIALCAEAGWRGGRIHDAVHILAAAQSECDLIYTYNLTDFRALAPERANMIQAPPQP
jgi:predicted nucleic acid-binding protein